MTTLFATLSHGNEPYILAASIGKALGNVIIPLIYPDKQESILRRWVGDTTQVYLDEGSGKILSRVIFNGDYHDYVQRVLQEGKRVQTELSEYLKDGFEAKSLTGKRKIFKQPEIELNIGSPVTLPNVRSFYIYPNLDSECADNSPLEIKGLKDYIALSKSAEEKHEAYFIPKINTFSYRDRNLVIKEISTPPLKRRCYNNDAIERGILLTFPGSPALHSELEGAAAISRMKTYQLGGDGLGNSVDTHEIIFNPNITAVLARAGWGTLWLCQVAEKPLITPTWKKTDEPEIYHNNRTVERLGLGIVYEEFTPEVFEEATAKRESIMALNKILFDQFGARYFRDGISFVQGNLKNMLKTH